MIKYIASDLDGTLLHNGAQHLPEEIFDLIRALKNAESILLLPVDVNTTICTGCLNLYRMKYPTLPIMVLYAFTGV